MTAGPLLVCVMADGQALQLVRQAHRSLGEVGRSWRVLHLDTVSARQATPAQRLDLEEALALAQREGARLVHSSPRINAGEHLVAQIAQQALADGASDVLLGDRATGTVQWPGFGVKLSDFTGLLGRRMPGVQVHVLVAPQQPQRTFELPGWTSGPRVMGRWSWSYWRLPLAALLLCTALCELIASRLHPINLILIYLVGVLYVALKRDLMSSVVTLLGAILVFDWIFVAPRWSFKPTDPQYFFTFAIALCVGLAVSRLATRAREAAVEALAVADRAQSMSLLARSLSTARTSDEIVEALQHAVGRGVGAKGDVLLVEGSSSGSSALLSLPPAGDACCFELQAAGGSLGELRVTHLPAQRQTAEDMHLLQSLANQAALALDRLNADLRSRQAAIQAETERVRNTLLAAISHDFRTPLTAIIGAATTVMTQGRQITAEQHDGLLHHMLDQARRLQSLTSDLLDLARLQDGAVNPEQEWCPVGELVRDALAVTRGALESHIVELQVVEDDIVWCDARLVTQAMSNLLLNAAQHSPAGSSIALAVQLQEDAWMLSVRDQGPGLAPGQERDVFNKFYRDPAAAAGTGTGLGLAICEVVARLHGGRIAARSERGAVFEMCLPWPKNAHPPLECTE
ncbi:ATP-binding protein [Hydrogenophaga pseudoflava]|uniref:ATP-binding protein n=1 Tax=Hydrogenophaga pseudoflava TaxID=47421 RepID=UPI0027E5691B|nr:ATP-binding protein [Hydrogenophaga pseudoflava]MDQ7744940.1 DUF4118 domain-containing protein [Hydrogenophaga pseudoflava]